MSVIEDWLVHLLMKKHGIQARQVETDREEESSSSFNEEEWSDDTDANNGYDTNLHFACLNNNFKAVKYLVEHGADVDARGKDDAVPLMYAKGKVALYLLEHGADPLCCDEHYEYLMPDSVLYDVREYARKKMMKYYKSKLEPEKG